MLTREQKAWLVTGFCSTVRSCGADCPLYDKCKKNYDYLLTYDDAQLDECLKIIAPELVEEPKPAATPQWISVDDKLPDRFKPVIVCREDTNGKLMVEPGFLEFNGRWLTNSGLTKKVTRWIPLPEPPEEDKHEEDQD